MVLKRVILNNFRNIDSADICFSDGMNIICGRNAQGKTNILEGIYIFACGKSFRKTKFKDMVKFGSDNCSLRVLFSDSKRENDMKINISESKRETVLNSIKITKLSDFMGHFRAVLFFPEHLSIVKNEPSVRRNFLDNAISQLKPQYMVAINDYAKIVTEKNSLIKNCEQYFDFDNLFSVLSERMAKYSGYITSERIKYSRLLFDKVSSFLTDMTGGKEQVSYSYVSNALKGQNDIENASQIEKCYYEEMMNNKQRELSAQTSIYGCHRDDVEIMLDGTSAKMFASQGQQRSIALAMKLAEGSICVEQTGDNPVFLLDDVLSELDRERKLIILFCLLIFIIKDRQVIITSCDESDFAGIDNVKKIYCANGTYSER